MRKLNRSVLSLSLIFAGFIPVSAQTADEIIQKHIDATGGVDNWKKVNSVKMNCTSNANGQEIPIIITILNGKGFKVEYTFNGMTGYSIITDKTGWTYSPFGGQTKPEVIPDETIKEAQDQLDLQGPLIDYKAKGNTVTYLGKDDVEGTECYKLKITFKNGKEETEYFDASNYNKIRSVTKIKANGKEQELTSNMGNYQKLPEGIVMAMSLDNGNGPLTVKSIEINKPVDDNFFKPADDSKANTNGKK